MVAFIKSLDSKSWKAILTAWEHPVIRDKDGKTTGELKPEAEWTKEEDELAHGNSKALNALFNAVDNNIFRMIKQCSVAKEAWDILMTTHEGTAKVKNSRLQLLTVKFENLMMGEDQSVHDFHMTILDFANNFDALGEKLSEERMVRKMLRSLPKMFDMKVTTIEEVHDIGVLKLENLVSSLLTYELAAKEKIEKRKKSISLVTNTTESEEVTTTNLTFCIWSKVLITSDPL